MAEGGSADRSRRARGLGGVTVGHARRSTPELSRIELSPEVAEALERRRPLVALETSIVGQGLPHPHNLLAAQGCEEAIREAGAVPATIAVLDRRLRIGLSGAELERIATDSVKISSRDLGLAIAGGWSGATTVAAAVRGCALSGIRFFATGGIGGVHRGHPEDVSADLEEIARSPVAVFCAGAKIILDLRLTLERLESLAVPVLGYGCDEFPAFYTRHSGCPVGARVDGAAHGAAVLAATWETGGRGVVVAVPPPTELDGAEEMARQATGELAHLSGASVTPRLLARMAELSGGRSVEVNVELVINNARTAAEVAAAYFA